METIAGLGQHWNDEARLRRSWHDEARFRPFYPYPYICDDGLLLGASTNLARMAKDRWGNPFLQIDGEEECILALLSLAHHKRLTTEAIRYFKRASAQWTKGDKVLAHFELAFARLPRFEARDDAFQLFCADGLFKQGVAPRWLMRYQGLDTGELDLLKYSPDQPRVPAGSGRESGRWTSGDGGAQVAEAPKAPSSGHREVVSDVSPDPIRPGQQYAQDRPKWWMPYQLPVDTGRGAGDTTGRGEGAPAGESIPAAQATSSRALARALETAGEVRPSGTAAHHIVAQGAEDADAARKILDSYGIEIDNAENGVFLPVKQHARLHTTIYYEAVNRALASARSREDAVRISNSIKRALKDGNFP